MNYSGPQADQSKPWYFFDSFDAIDPKNGVTAFPSSSRGDLTAGLPIKTYGAYYPSGHVGDLYYPGNRGARLVFDMTGARDMNDTTHRIALTDIYGFEATYDAGDSLLFYNLDVMFQQPFDKRWIYLARPDSMLKPFAVLTTTGKIAGTWSNVSVSQNIRYIMVRWLPKSRGSYSTIPDFHELMFYGTYPYDPTTLDTRPDSYSGPLPSKAHAGQTYGAFIGTNLGQGIDTLQLQYDGNIRVYGSTNYWDKDATASTVASAKYTFDNFLDIGPTQYPAFKRAGQRAWWSIRGSSSYINTTVPGGTGVNIDNWYADPENPYNYSRDGDFYYNYAAKFGSVAVPSGNTKWIGDAGHPNGQNTIGYVENGNEEDAHSISELAYWARTMCDYDGYEGRVGVAGRTGLKTADPNFKLIMSATMEVDTNLLDNFVWFSKIMRADGKFPFDVVNFHHYPRNADVLGYAPGYEQEVGEHGESPEADDIYGFYTSSAKAVYNYIDGDTTVKIYNTEYGYGNWGTPAANTTQASYPWDFGCVPSAGGYDSLTLKAILMGRSELIMAFTPYAAYNEFFFHNSSFGANNFMLFSSYGRTTGRDAATFRATTFFPWWYFRAGMYNSLKNYYPDKLITNNGTNAWVTRWRNVSKPDSVCYVVWKGSYTGAVLTGYSVPVGSVLGNNVNRVDLSFTTITGTTTPITSGGGYINVDVTEKPVLYFLREDTLSVSNQPPVANAGPSQTIPLPVPVSLDGSASYDPDGTIAAYKWAELSGPAGPVITADTAVKPVITGLKQGVYIFQLTVTDNKGATGRDTMTLTVGAPANKAPVAIAGKDTTINYPAGNLAFLNGSASYDPDGTITAYSWKQVKGPVPLTIQTPKSATTTVTQLAEGDFAFELTVTDDQNATAKDTVLVSVVVNLRYTGLIKVYPNPITGNTITIDAYNDQMGKVRVALFDVGGKLITESQYDKQASVFRQQMNIGTLNKGAYILSVQFYGMDTPLVYRLVKQ